MKLRDRFREWWRRLAGRGHADPVPPIWRAIPPMTATDAAVVAPVLCADHFTPGPGLSPYGMRLRRAGTIDV